MSTQKSKLIIKTFDGSMKKLNILPQNKETKIEFEIDYYDDNDALTNATLSFDIMMYEPLLPNNTNNDR